MTLQSSGPIRLGQIAAEFNCPERLYDCAVAAGLPTTNIKFSDFYGLSAWTPIISPNTSVEYEPKGSTIAVVFNCTATNAPSPITFSWAITGGAAIYSGQGSSAVQIRLFRSTTGQVSGTLTCTVNNEKLVVANYTFNWVNG